MIFSVCPFIYFACLIQNDERKLFKLNFIRRWFTSYSFFSFYSLHRCHYYECHFNCFITLATSFLASIWNFSSSPHCACFFEHSFFLYFFFFFHYWQLSNIPITINLREPKFFRRYLMIFTILQFQSSE